MSVRADFYTKIKTSWSWIGSIAFDGQPKYLNKKILQAKTKKDFIREVIKETELRDDANNKKWIWQENSSSNTDYCYVWENNQLHIAHFGRGWVSSALYFYAQKIEWKSLQRIDFPLDMKNRLNDIKSPFYFSFWY